MVNNMYSSQVNNTFGIKIILLGDFYKNNLDYIGLTSC